MTKDSLKLIIDISDYEPWSGAKETWEKITDADMVEELENFLEEAYPDGLTVTGLNDLLWFDGDYVLEMLGLDELEEDEIKEDEDEVEEKTELKDSELEELEEVEVNNKLIGSPKDSDGALQGIRLWCGSGHFLNNPVYIYSKEVTEDELVRASLLDEDCLWIPANEADEDLEEADNYIYLDRTSYGSDCGYLCIENLKVQEYPERDLSDELQNEFFKKHAM